MKISKELLEGHVFFDLCRLNTKAFQWRQCRLNWVSASVTRGLSEHSKPKAHITFETATHDITVSFDEEALTQMLADVVAMRRKKRGRKNG